MCVLYSSAYRKPKPRTWRLILKEHFLRYIQLGLNLVLVVKQHKNSDSLAKFHRNDVYNLKKIALPNVNRLSLTNRNYFAKKTEYDLRKVLDFMCQKPRSSKYLILLPIPPFSMFYIFNGACNTYGVAERQRKSWRSAFTFRCFILCSLQANDKWNMSLKTVRLRNSLIVLQSCLCRDHVLT